MLRVRSKGFCNQMLLGWLLLASASPSVLAQTMPAAPPAEAAPATSPIPAPPPPASPRALELVAVISQLLQQSPQQTEGNNFFKLAGPVEINDRPDGSIVIAIPQIMVTAPAGQTIIPPTFYTEGPLEGGRRKVTAQLPNQISWQSTDQKDSILFKIGRQSIDFTWIDGTILFEKANISLGDISVESPTRPTKILISDLDFVQDLVERTPGSWSGPQALTVKNLRAVGKTTPPPPPDLSVGSIETSGTITDVRLIDYANHLKTVGLHPPAAPAPTTGGDGELLRFRRIADLLRDLPKLIGAITSTIQVKEVAVTAAGTPGFAFSGASVSWSAGSEGDGMLKIGIAFDMEKLLLDGDLKPSRNADLFPHSAGLALTLDKVPGAALWGMMLGNFDQALELQMAALREQNTVEPEPDDTGQPPADEDIEEDDTDEETTDIAEEPSPIDEAVQSALVTSLAMALPVLANHPPRLSLDRFDILGSVASAKAGGALSYNPNAQYYGDGAFDISLSGLDKVIDTISKAPPRSEERETLPLLTALRGVAKADVVDNAILHRLRVEIPAKGDITINGISLDALMNPPKQKPQKPKK